MRKAAIAALVVMLTLGAAPSLHAATQRDWENYFDAVAAGANAAVTVAVGEILPPGATDVVSVLSASPDVVQAGLIIWLNKRMQQAIIEDENDTIRVNRYQAFLDCLSPKHDCARMRALTSVSSGATGGSNGTNTSGANTNKQCQTKGGICGTDNNACCSKQCTDCLENPHRCYCR